MRLLLISNSTNAGQEYLKYPLGEIKDFLGEIDSVLFVPYAAVTFSFDAYLKKVSDRLSEIGVRVESVHDFTNPVEAVAKARAIVVGGGNTFALASQMQRHGLMKAIGERIAQGVPYIGWSAGSNVACPTICTTNDMPIVEPESFRAIGAVSFQINPHYLDAHPDGHAGETREQRIEEYIGANPNVYVAGLREGSMLRVEGEKLSLIGARPMRIFRRGEAHFEVESGDDLSFLMR